MRVEKEKNKHSLSSMLWWKIGGWICGGQGWHISNDYHTHAYLELASPKQTCRKRGVSTAILASETACMLICIHTHTQTHMSKQGKKR